MYEGSGQLRRPGMGGQMDWSSIMLTDIPPDLPGF